MEKTELIGKLSSISSQILNNDENFKDIDELLDERDDELFSTPWGNEYDNVEEIKTEENKTLIDSIREKIFKEIFNKSNSSDLSSYVSDDFALLMDAVNSDYESKWLNSLLFEYTKGNIPKGDIGEKEGTLSSIIISAF